MPSSPLMRVKMCMRNATTARGSQYGTLATRSKIAIAMVKVMVSRQIVGPALDRCSVVGLDLWSVESFGPGMEHTSGAALKIHLLCCRHASWPNPHKLAAHVADRSASAQRQRASHL